MGIQIHIYFFCSKRTLTLSRSIVNSCSQAILLIGLQLVWFVYVLSNFKTAQISSETHNKKLQVSFLIIGCELGCKFNYVLLFTGSKQRYTISILYNLHCDKFIPSRARFLILTLQHNMFNSGLLHS